MIRDVSRAIVLLLVGLVVAATVPSVALGSGVAGSPVDAVAPEAGSTASQVGTAAASTARSNPDIQASQQGAAPQEVTECTTIDSPGYYVLAGNITRDAPPEEQTTCIDISADDVVLDGNGHEIEGNISVLGYARFTVVGGAAIRAANASNITIRDVRVRSWKYGIRLADVTDADVQFRGYDYAGISAVRSEHIRLHDSMLRSANVDLDAEHVVVRRNDINADYNEGIISDGDGIGVEGSDAVIENNRVNAPGSDQRLFLVGIALAGNRSLIRDNLVIGTPPPTRRDPLELDGGGFEVTGDDNRITNLTVERTLQSSGVFGDNNSLTDSRMNISSSPSWPLYINGTDNTVSDSVVTTGGTVRFFGSGGKLVNVSATQGRVSFRATNGTVVDSRARSLSLFTNVTSRNVTIRQQVTIRGAASSITNSSAESVTVEGSDATVVHNRIESEISVTGSNNLIRDNGALTGTLTLSEATGNAIRNVSVPSVEIRESDGNRLGNVTTDTVSLESSERNNLSRVTAAETITLRSISDNNTITQGSADLITIAENSRNNTVRASDAAIRVAGQTSFDNRLLDNRASGASVGIELDQASRTLVLNNTVTNNTQGIVLDGANDNRLPNNTATGNDGPAYRSRNGSVNNTVENLTIGPTVSFRSRDVALATEPAPPAPPAGRADVGVFLNATGTSADAWLNLTTTYPDTAAADVDEETLRLWRYDGTWTEVPGFNRVDPAANTVRANVTADGFGVLAPLGNGTTNDTTAPTVTAFDARADGGALVVAFDASERLVAIDTVVTNASGETVARLNASDFTESGTGPYTYSGRVALPNGTYTATLERAADAAGNDGAAGQSATATVDGGVVPLSLVANRTDIAPGETVRFTVTRADTGEPVNATVQTATRTVVTGPDGRVDVSFPDAGSVTVTATKADTSSETFRNATVEITVGSAPAGASRLAVVPASETVAPGESVRVAVVYNGSAGAETYGVQFALDYNTTLLNVTNVTRGPYLGSADETLVVSRSVDREAGRVNYGESRRTTDGVTGNGTVAYVELRATDRLGDAATRTNLSLAGGKVSDPEGRRIDTTRANGSVLIGQNSPPTLAAALSFEVNNVGSPVRVAVNATDSSRVRNVRLFGPNGSEADILACDASECNGSLSAVPRTSSWNDSSGTYDQVSYRVVATDSEGANATTTLRSEIYIAGDGTGDGVVDIADAVEVGQGWNCAVGESCYSDAGDLNNDGVVDIFDAVLIGRSWQETAGT